MRDIKKITDKLKKKYTVSSPQELCDALGIFVYHLELGNINGHYLYAKRKKVFFINNRLTPLEAKLCLAHELGHAMLHPKSNYYFLNDFTHFSIDKHEKEADKFAAEFVISDDLLSEYEGFPLSVISRSTGIPLKFLELKFKDKDTIK